MHVRRLIGIVCLLVVLGGCVFMYHRDILPTISVVETHIQTTGVYAPFIFMGSYALLTIFFVPGTPLTLLAGVFFGPIWGTIYVLLGASVGAVGAFSIARLFRRLLLMGQLAKVSQQLAAYDERLRQNGFVTTLILRLIPLFPFNALNYGLGLTAISTRSYIAGTVIGIIPGTFAYVNFGSSVSNFTPVSLGVAVGGIVVVTLLGRYLLTYYK